MNEFKNISTLKGCAAEFIAVLLFVFLGAGVVVSSGILSSDALTPARLVAIALGNGLTICMLVYATAHISGGHINPAVTIATVITGKTSFVKGIMFIIAQILGAIVGAYMLGSAVPEAVQGSLASHSLAQGITVPAGLLTEIILTFVLVFVIFATATDNRAVNKMAPLAIGLAVVVAHLVGVPITGTGLNPARSIGPAIVSGTWINHWIYWVGPIIGGMSVSYTHLTLPTILLV